MKKSLYVLLVSFIVTTSSFALTLTSVCDYSPFTDTDYSVMQSNLDQSASLVVVSQNLLVLSNSLLLNASSTNSEYVNAMLRLSDDIGAMADRIGEMADRIVATEILIGDMADRILATQELQSSNLALTQANLLKAQENFNALLIQLAN
ncbi:hypothetical protein [Sulfurimonas sp.]